MKFTYLLLAMSASAVSINKMADKDRPPKSPLLLQIEKVMETEGVKVFVNNPEGGEFKEFGANVIIPEGCGKEAQPIPITNDELSKELDYFSRRLDMKYYDAAMKIYNEMEKSGSNPGALKVNTWELYNAAFMKSFPLVRR